MFSSITYEKKERVAFLTLNRPQVRNALSHKMVMEMIEALKEADSDAEVGAVVIKGEGKAFCAGGDIGEFAQVVQKSPVEVYTEGAETTELFQLGDRMKKPLIGAINGLALGGGVGLTAMCHLAIAAEEATFGLTEIKLGFYPFVIMPLVLRATGYRKAMELSLTGEIIDAQKAKEIGLISEVVPAQELEAKVLQIATKIAGRSPLALQMGLFSILQASKMPLDDATSYLNILRTISFKSEDLVEGATAFIERRKPKWKGR